MWGEVQNPLIMILPGILMCHCHVQVAGYWSRPPVQNVWMTLQTLIPINRFVLQESLGGIPAGSPSGLVHDSTVLADESCENILWLVKYHAILISPAILYKFSWYLVFIIFTMELSFTFLLSPCCPVRLINPCSGENTPELYRIFSCCSLVLLLPTSPSLAWPVPWWNEIFMIWRA